MKVADLIDDLETGDRSMEHLKKGDEPEGGLSFQRLRDAFNSLGQGYAGFTGGGIFSGLGQQAFQNQQANQQAQAANAMNSAFGQGYVSNNTGIGGNPWNR